MQTELAITLTTRQTTHLLRYFTMKTLKHSVLRWSFAGLHCLCALFTCWAAMTEIWSVYQVARFESAIGVSSNPDELRETLYAIAPVVAVQLPLFILATVACLRYERFWAITLALLPWVTFLGFANFWFGN
jgi:hypothetical protein